VTSNSQSLNNRLGKILRINSDGSYPADNPFYTTSTAPRSAIWALGFRNPYTFAVQPGTGRIFVNDVGSSGANSREEINDLVRGGNYGWPNVEGIAGNPAYIDPVHAYAHGSGAATGNAITGGAFYNPPLETFPASFTGDYFHTDYTTTWIRVYDPVTDTDSAFATAVNGGPVDLKVGPDGSLYYILIGSGQLRRISFPSSIAGRHVFYNNSAWDNNDPAAGASDDAAIAPDKTALLPGGTGAFANYTSYTRGLNGLMVDIANLPRPASLTAADFSFRVGNDNSPAAWAAAPAPSSITVRPGAGSGGSDRVTLIWPDGAIQKQWLQVSVLATPATGLPAASVFYFGNAVGETGNSTTNAIVSSADEALTRLNARNAFNPAPIDFAYDFNRDKLVAASDQALSRSNATNALNALRLIVAPASSGAAAGGLSSEEQAVLAAALSDEDAGQMARSRRGRRR
jgi:hypothetical protein